jgi:hypothetical protein
MGLDYYMNYYMVRGLFDASRVARHTVAAGRRQDVTRAPGA